MKGFLLGVLTTLIVGGVFYYLQTHYQTLNTCVAVEKTLTSSVIADLQADIESKTGSVVGQIAKKALQPVADPMIADKVRKDTQDKNWFQCAMDLIKIDFLGGREARVEAIKQRLP